MSVIYARVYHRLSQEIGALDLPVWYHTRVQEFCLRKIIAGGL